ncbi:MAG TPA: hypothetical protein VGC93_13945, partial [Thermoanaerobaculia bacterium]
MAERVWEELSRTLRSSAPYRALLAGLGEVVRLPVPAAAWVSQLLSEDLGRPLLALVPREADALTWMEAAQLFGREEGAVYFPAPSLTPYQETETSLQVRAQEALALDRVLAGGATTVVATPRALFRLLPSAADFAAARLTLRPGDEHPPERLVERLLAHGYRRTDLVYEVGDFAVRGGILDLFPPGEAAPVRLDYFGDTVEAIRWFDPQSQRSEDTLDEVRVLPLLLFPGGPGEVARLADLLLRYDPDLGPEGAERIEALRERGGFPGWEHYLALLAPSTVTLPELLGEPLVVAVEPAALAAEAEHHAERLAADFAARREHRRLAVPPEALEAPAKRVLADLRGAEVRIGDLLPAAAAPAPRRESIRVVSDQSIGVPSAPRPAGRAPIDFHGAATDLFHGQLPRFPQEVATARARGERCLVVVPPLHRRRMEELFEARDVRVRGGGPGIVGPGGVELVAGDLSRGFRLPPAGVVVYGEQQLLPQAKPQMRPPARGRFGP